MGRGDPDDELLALFAIDALEGEELDEVERAVAVSPELAARVEQHRSTAAALAQVDTATPPPELKQRVLDAAFAESPPRAAVGGDAPSVVLPFERPQARRDRVRWIGFAGGIAAALLLGVVLLGRDDGPSVQSATAVLIGAAGELDVAVEDGRRIVLSGDELAPLADDQTYELWLVDPDRSVRSAGVFEPRDDGTVDVELTLALDGAEAMAVTVEPSGGSPTPGTPTGPIVLQAALG